MKEADINLIYAGRDRARFALATSDAERQAARQTLKETIATMRSWIGKARAQPKTAPNCSNS